MKKILYSLLLLIGLLAPMAVSASAGAVNVGQACSGAASGSAACKELSGGGGTNPIVNDLKIALEIISIVAGFAAVVMIILGGIKLTTASGDPSSIKTGRDQIIYSLIGVVAVIFCQAIVAFVIDKIG